MEFSAYIRAEGYAIIPISADHQLAYACNVRRTHVCVCACARVLVRTHACADHQLRVQRKARVYVHTHARAHARRC